MEEAYADPPPEHGAELGSMCTRALSEGLYSSHAAIDEKGVTKKVGRAAYLKAIVYFVYYIGFHGRLK